MERAVLIVTKKAGKKRTMIDELYLQALDKAYLELKTQLSNKNAFSNEFECFYTICTMLHWSLD